MDNKIVIPNVYYEAFTEFMSTPEAQTICNYWLKGLLTFDESIRELEKIREEQKHYYIVRCKRDKRGARWRDYSGTGLTKRQAELYADELNNGVYGHHDIAIDGSRIVYKVFALAK